MLPFRQPKVFIIYLVYLKGSISRTVPGFIEYFYFLINLASSGLSSIPVNRSTVM